MFFVIFCGIFIRISCETNHWACKVNAIGHIYLGTRVYAGSDVIICQAVIVNKLALTLSLGSSSNNYDQVSKGIKNTETLSLNLFSNNRNL
jgi:hypothetical protein